MTIYRLGEHAPKIHETAFVAPDATVIGQVTLEAGASVWPGAVLRGDIEPIVIGEGTNVQDGAVVHTDPGSPVYIGPYVTVGHQAMLHGCVIERNALIGIQSIVMNGVHIGENTLVGAGSLVPEGKRFAPGIMILGSPARMARQLTEEEIEWIAQQTQLYVERCQYYKENLVRIG